MSLEQANNINPVAELWNTAKDKPLTVDQLKLALPQMRADLIEAGVNLTPTPEVLMSLAEKKYPNSREGRGPGVVATLGETKATKLIGFCANRCKSCPITDKGNENSRGRGLKQVTADLIQLLIDPDPSDEQIDIFILKTNQRIKKYSEIRPKRTPQLVKDTYNAVPKIEPDQKWKEFKSIPYDSLPDLWDFLVEK